MDAEQAQAGDIEPLSLLFADVFMEDPVWSAIVPKDSARHRIIRKGFLSELKTGDYRNVDVVRDEDGEPLGALHYAPPGSKPSPSTRERLVAKLASAVSPSAKRGLKHDSAVNAHRPSGPHWYFRDLVTSENARGRGIGSKLFANRLAIIDQDPLPVFLESTSEASKRLYERFGFEHVATVSAIEDCTAYIMVRPAQQAQ